MRASPTSQASSVDSRRRDYRRAYVATGGLVAVLAAVSAVSPTLDNTRGNYLGLVGFVLALWSPLVLITTRRLFLAVVAVLTAALATTIFVGALLALITLPMVVAGLFPAPPRDARTSTIVGGTVAVSLVLVGVVAFAVMPAHGPRVALYWDQRPSQDVLTEAIYEVDDEGPRIPDDVATLASRTSLLCVEFWPFTPRRRIDAFVARAEASGIFTDIAVDVPQC